MERPTLFTEMWDFLEKRRDRLWRDEVRQFDREIFDRAVAAYDRYAIEELRKLADEKGLWADREPAHCSPRTQRADRIAVASAQNWTPPGRRTCSSGRNPKTIS